MSTVQATPANVDDADVIGDLLQLVAKLSLQDIDDLQANKKGKALDSAPLTDEELAFQLYAEEANGLLTFATDAILARSIDEALRTDRPVIQQMVAAENTAVRDRQMALALSQSRAPPPPPPAQPRQAPGGSHSGVSVVWDTSSATIGSHPVGKHEDARTSRAASSNSGLSRFGTIRSNATAAKVTNDCVICMEKIKGVEVRAPCGHHYDVKCLVELFKSTLTDESLFPPRCCKRSFVFAEVRHYLGVILATSFEKKSNEFSVPNRVYCYQPTCSSFLGAATDAPSLMMCYECYSHTCGHCKEPAHGHVSCAAKHDATVLALAEQEGWKRCPGCHRLVELSMGCYHMTCLCKKEFCYICTETWKQCDCPQWEENRLLTAATDRVNRQIRQEPRAQAPAAPVNFMQRVAMEAQRLRYRNNVTTIIEDLILDPRLNLPFDPDIEDFDRDMLAMDSPGELIADMSLNSDPPPTVLTEQCSDVTYANAVDYCIAARSATLAGTTTPPTMDRRDSYHGAAESSAEADSGSR
ncbi:hypothetical protein EUX98_g8615, partial [Antrodiella citrinella]